MNSSPTPGLDSPWAAGEQVDGWTLDKPLRAAGPGPAWLLARPGDAPDIAVLLDLGPAAPGEAARERFAREAQALTRLQHPHLVRVLKASPAEAPRRYLIVEHQGGEPLDAYCDARCLTLPYRLELFLQVCDAVAHAHAHLVLHRDLRPARVRVGPGGQVRLRGTGLAGLLEPEGNAGSVDGLARRPSAAEPHYRAPEQWQGQPAGTAADVYALGVLLYTLLCGHRPYGRPEDPPAELVRYILDTEPTAMYRRLGVTGQREADLDIARRRGTTPERLAEALTGDLHWIAVRALRKLPAERYPSAHALAEDVRRVLRDEPIAGRTPTWRARMVRKVRQHRLGTAVAVVSVGAIATALVAGGWQLRQTGQAALEARQAADSARADARQARDTTASAFELLDAAHAALAASAPGAQPSLRDLLIEAERQLVERRDLPLGSHLALIQGVGQLSVRHGLPQSAQRLARHAIGLARQGLSPSCDSLGRAELDAGSLLAQSGQREESDTLLAEAVSRCEADPRGPAQDTLPLALLQLADNLRARGDARGALGHQQRAVELLARFHPEHPQRHLASLALAQTLASLEQFDAAQRTLASMAPSAAPSEGTPAADEVARLATLGRLYRRMGRYADALEPLEQAWPIAQRELGAGEFDASELLTELALVLHQNHADEEARKHLALAERLSAGQTAAGDAATAGRLLMARARMGLAEGDFTSGLAAAREATQRFGPGSDVAGIDAWVVLGDLELALGRASQAELAGQHALSLARDRLGPQALLTQRAAVLTAEALVAQGQAGAAQAYWAMVKPPQADAGATAPAWGLMQARARLSQARAALEADPRQALRLAHEALDALPKDDGSRGHGLLRAQVGQVQGTAYVRLGQVSEARAALEDALGRIAPGQVPHSPRLVALRTALNALPAERP